MESRKCKLNSNVIDFLSIINLIYVISYSLVSYVIFEL